MLKVTTAEEAIKVDCSTELELQWALQRRGIAFDQCGLIEWQVHQRWVQQLLSLLTKAVPEGYSRIKMSQLLKADRELFLVMSEELQQTGDRLSDAPSPMNTAFPKLVTDPRITMHLLPLPQFSSSKSSSSGQLNTSNRHESNQTSTKGSPKGRGKVRRDGKQSSKAKALCPAELKDFKQTDDQGRPICWAYNLKSGCKEQTSDGRCKKGVHMCMKCKRSNHGLANCRATS
eukprot:s386_g3.t1